MPATSKSPTSAMWFLVGPFDSAETTRYLPIYTLPFALPVLGILPINPLPLLMTASSIWQQKLTPQTGDQQQAKMMMFMPLIMLFMFYNMASGLTLYWTLQQFLSILQQWLSLRKEGRTAPVLTTGNPK